MVRTVSLTGKICDYIIWADNQIWNIVETLSDEEFSKTFGEFGGSVRSRYVHLAEDIWEWYHDWTGQDPEGEPNFVEMKRDELFESILEYNQKLKMLLKTGSPSKFSFEVKGKSITLSLDEFVFHMANHATYHRGQIVTCLRMLGKQTQMTDYVPYLIAL